jgi:hypothetical protein
MSGVPILEKARVEGWADEEIVRRVLEGDLAAYHGVEFDRDTPSSELAEALPP